MRTIRHLLAAALFAPVALLALPAKSDELVKQGSFYDGPYAPGHRVSGEARLVRTQDGGYELRLSGFVSDEGPDVYIIVSTAEKPTKDAHIKQSEWTPLGKRSALTGDQSYPVPEGLDPDEIRSVGVWCKRYSVLFGAAALE